MTTASLSHFHGANRMASALRAFVRRRRTVLSVLGAANGVAIAAAAGILLTVTGTVGALGYMTWALADRFWGAHRRLQLQGV
jgi:hypothetical protein